MKKMHKKKIRKKNKLVSAVLVSAMLVGNMMGYSTTVVAGDLSQTTWQTNQAYTQDDNDFSYESEETETSVPFRESLGDNQDERWYVLGRPMTEEEEAEQIRLTRYYNSQSAEIEIPEAEEKEMVSMDINCQGDSWMGDFAIDTIPTQDVPRQYSSRDLGYTPAVRNQGTLGNCWAHTAMACVEISMAKKGIVPADQVNALDLCENHMIYYYHRPVVDPLGGTAGDYDYAITGNNIYQMYNSGNYVGSVWGTLFAWMGPVAEDSTYEYNNLLQNHYETFQGGELNTKEMAYGDRKAIMTEYFSVPLYKIMEVKKAIMEYGAVGTYYNSEDQYYNPESAAHYCHEPRSKNHAVTIVGWDDNFSRTNFKTEPTGNGAWLVRNSWGSGWGDEGYFWISYDDNSLGGAHVFNTVSPDKYDNNYHYDRAATDIGYVSGPEGGKIEGANLFTIQKEKELLKAVQFHIMYSNLKYSIQIYKNPSDLSDPTTGEALLTAPLVGARKYSGQYTVDLNIPIELVKDDKIAVCVTYWSQQEEVQPALPRTNTDTSVSGQGMYRTFSQEQWSGWNDCGTEGNYVIRAFTVDADDTTISHQHDWDIEWSYNDTHHWHDCNANSGCTAEEGRAMGTHSGGEATCISRAVCEICHSPYGTFQADNHSGSQVKINVVAATTTQTGYTGDLACSGCDYIFEKGEETPKLSSDTPIISGVENLSYTFKKLDDTLTTTTANGKPKILMFYGAKCWHCIDTLRDFTTNKVEGADICAIDIKSYPKEEIQSLIDVQLGEYTDYIEFCYDDNWEDEYNAPEARTAYEKAFSGMSSYGLPVLFYVDANNQIRHMTSGTQTSKGVTSILANYCNMTSEGLNIDNPATATYTSFDGQPVSSVAEGKPKVIIYSLVAEPTVSVLQSFAAEELPGVDVCVIDNWNSWDPEASRNYLEGILGTDSHITACCGDGDKSYYEVEKIMNAAGIDMAELAYPLVCCIDADNKLQYLSMGETNLENIKLKLKLNCGWNPDGGQPDEEDPEDEKPTLVDYVIMSPPKTTYFLGESIDLTGGKLQLANGSQVDMTADMITFESPTTEGENEISVSYQNTTKTFRILVVAKPLDLTAMKGETLADVKLPVGSWGAFSWKNPDTILNETGEYEVNFIPTSEAYSPRYNLMITVTVSVPDPEPIEKYTVSFDLQGHGAAIDAVEIPEGENVREPEKPVEEGWIFEGWYKDEECTKPWNFETDKVNNTLTLYAKWTQIVLPEAEFIIEEIVPLTYTGKALKPVVRVYDKGRLLKAGVDYKITYKNNVNVNEEEVEDGIFKEQLPHVIIQGKGNYDGIVKKNFSILPAAIVTESGEPAVGVKIGYSNQLVVNTSKAVSPLKNIKFKKILKEGQDYTVSLVPLDAKDNTGALIASPLTDGKIPAGSKGSFSLTITGVHNYTGSWNTTVMVAEKSQLLQQAKITLGKNIQNIDFSRFTGELNSELTAGCYDSSTKTYHIVKNGEKGAIADKKDIFTVKQGNKYLLEGKDYVVSYRNADKTGTATLTVTGMGSYAGSKSIQFKLSGKAFKNNTVTITGLEDKIFTGKPIIQDTLKLRYEGENEDMQLNQDYTIAYAGNITKGTATMTFTAVEDSGYQGSFKRTFKILAQPLTQIVPEAGTENILAEYDKSGARPAEMVILTNAEGISLVNGIDYRLDYKNNKAVGEKNGSAGPVIIVNGKGNYSGQIEIPFTITKASLESEKISISVKSVAYNEKKPDNYTYKPAVTVKDGKKRLQSDVDYQVTYENNTQLDYKNYYLNKNGLSEELRPRIKIEAVKEGSYVTESPIYIDLPVYRNKFTAKNLHVVISSVKYTGSQCQPDITVYYAPMNDAAKVRGMTEEEQILAAGLVKLEETDYMLEYGSNILTGKNKGNVKVIGKGALYGGAVRFKFAIDPRDIVIE